MGTQQTAIQARYSQRNPKLSYKETEGTIVHTYLLIVYSIKTFSLLVHLETMNHINPSPRTGPQDLLGTNYDCKDQQQRTLHKYAINKITKCEYEPQDTESATVEATH